MISSRGYLLKSFPKVNTPARQRAFEIRLFPLLCELPKSTEPHLPVCLLYRWQLGPNMWSSPTTESFDPFVVTSHRVGFPEESHRPATCGFACNCPESKAWATEASGRMHTYTYTSTQRYMHIYIYTYMSKITHKNITQPSSAPV